MSITPVLDHAPDHARSRARRSRAALLLCATALTGGLLTSTAGPAQADAPPAPVPAPTAATTVVQVAQQLVGTPYLWGGTTPAGFDCSGYTGFVFSQVGVWLPRTANDQMWSSRWIPADQAAPGDLVFFASGGRAYHTAIYAGNGWIYDASGTGGAVSLRPMWTSAVVYGRVLG